MFSSCLVLFSVAVGLRVDSFEFWEGHRALAQGLAVQRALLGRHACMYGTPQHVRKTCATTSKNSSNGNNNYPSVTLTKCGKLLFGLLAVLVLLSVLA